MKIAPRVSGDITLVAAGYTYNYRKVLWYITTEVDGSNEPGDPYLSC